MNNFTIRYPVHTLDKRFVLPAGTEFSARTMNSFDLKNMSRSARSLPFLGYGSIRKDLLEFLSQPPYEAMFKDTDLVARIFSELREVNLMLPFLESLDYFKEHDFYTYRHILLVFALTAVLARRLVPDYRSWRVQHAAAGPTHDFGKICVPLNILKKTTPLTRTEQSMLSHHAEAGYILLSCYHRDRTNPAAQVARDHHERRNGSGYPRGILLRNLLVEIVAVADVYDALISPRPYRPVSYDNRTALEEITGMAARKEASWKTVKALIALNRRTRAHLSCRRVSAEKRGTPPAGNVHGTILGTD